jgi:hypothetical protein
VYTLLVHQSRAVRHSHPILTVTRDDFVFEKKITIIIANVNRIQIYAAHESMRCDVSKSFPDDSYRIRINTVYSRRETYEYERQKYFILFIFIILFYYLLFICFIFHIMFVFIPAPIRTRSAYLLH